MPHVPFALLIHDSVCYVHLLLRVFANIDKKKFPACRKDYSILNIYSCKNLSLTDKPKVHSGK